MENVTNNKLKYLVIFYCTYFQLDMSNNYNDKEIAHLTMNNIVEYNSKYYLDEKNTNIINKTCDYIDQFIPDDIKKINIILNKSNTDSKLINYVHRIITNYNPEYKNINPIILE
jgi:hypothetical protein